MSVAKPLVLMAASALSFSALGDTGTFELRYRFNQPGGMPSEHEFLLKWTDSNSNLQTITVLQAEGGKVVQTISVPQDRVQLLWRDIVVGDKGTKDKIIDYVDYNFDQLGDIRLTQRWPYRTGQKMYLIWLYNEVENKYALAEDLSRLPAPVADAKSGLIHSTRLGAYAGGEFVSDTYSVEPDGGLILETRISQTIKDPARLRFTREIQSMNLTRPRTICRYDIPAEGRPRTTWGLPDTCDAFLVKTAPLGIPLPTEVEDLPKPESPEKGKKSATPKPVDKKPSTAPVAH